MSNVGIMFALLKNVELCVTGLFSMNLLKKIAVIILNFEQCSFTIG